MRRMLQVVLRACAPQVFEVSIGRMLQKLFKEDWHSLYKYGRGLMARVAIGYSVCLDTKHVAFMFEMVLRSTFFFWFSNTNLCVV